jgi:hypothetical protein
MARLPQRSFPRKRSCRKPLPFNRRNKRVTPMRGPERSGKKAHAVAKKQPTSGMNRSWWAVPCAAAACDYLPSLSFGFVADDYTQIVNNPQVQVLAHRRTSRADPASSIKLLASRTDAGD